MPAPENRKSTRIQRQYSAQINVYDGEKLTHWEVVTVQNISSGGMLFSYRKLLESGTMLKARIFFPPSDKPIEVVGRAVRSKASGVIYFTGIFFIEIAPEQQELIDFFAARWFPH